MFFRVFAVLLVWRIKGEVCMEGDLLEDLDNPALTLMQRDAKAMHMKKAQGGAGTVHNVQHARAAAKLASRDYVHARRSHGFAGIMHSEKAQAGGSSIVGIGPFESLEFLSSPLSENWIAGLLMPSLFMAIVWIIFRVIWQSRGWLRAVGEINEENKKEMEVVKNELYKDLSTVEVKIKEEDKGFVYRASTTGYLFHFNVCGIEVGFPVWGPPAMVVFCILFAVFGLPLFVGGPFTWPTKIMCIYFACYISTDALLRLLFGFSKYRIFLHIGFTHQEVELMCGDQKEIPTRHLLEKSPWVYRFDSWSRKILHIFHWAGLAYIVGLCTYTTYQRFQFSVMGATCSVIAQLCLWRSTNFLANMWFWLSTVRTGDGFARRMNNIYCTTSSICGMGVVVPLSASLLAYAFHGESPTNAAAFIIIVTYPCAWGDVMAEVIGVMGTIRFNVYGIGEINNKSVEGMIGMFLFSVLPCIPWAWSIGGWPNMCIVGVLATIAETWSPRGFDNVFIPFFSAVGILIVCWSSGIAPHTTLAPGTPAL